MTDNRTNDEFIMEFMTFRKLMHQMFVVNGLRVYAEMILNPANAHMNDWLDTIPFIDKRAYLAAAADYIREYDEKYAPDA